MMKKSGVYKIENMANGKLYVGSAVNIEGNRWPQHKRKLRNNEHCNKHLQAAWNKYNESSFRFEIIEECEPLKEILIAREQYYIDMLRPEYNMCPKAYSCLGRETTEETKKKLSESHRGENNYNFGKHLSEDQKQKLSEAHKGKHHSEQTKEKISESHRGENNFMFGKHHSEQTKEKISEAQSGENHPQVKLNWDLVHEIRRRYKEEKITRKQLGLEYGVSGSCIQNIVENRNWKEEGLEKFVPVPRAKLNWDIVREIRQRCKEENINQKQLAKEYGVTPTNISYILAGRSWKEMSEENN